ncbi:ParA family protein [Azohydromonas aeria]|uniref:ParA family protein n=1 Tax=Azohydromonas aeria TaxID=2590212 RepID=UPI0012FC9C56|nr:AAA family ATPase [Azohydromonas aeria]
MAADAVSPTPALSRGVTLDDLNRLDFQISSMMERIRSAIYRPTGEKRAPRFNATQLAALCGKSHAAMLRLLDKSAEFGLANGLVTDESGNKLTPHRSFSLEQAIDWVRHVGARRYARQPGQLGTVISVGLFKGGIGKTTLATSLAQGLSLRSYSVLLVDLDPQGSATAVMGSNPGAIGAEETVEPVTRAPGTEGYRASLAESIRPTYWSGVDLIAGSTSLFASEFYLPLRSMEAQREGKQFNFLEVLSQALHPLRSEYDYIILDLPPALSYLTMNAYWASDALILPVVPEGLSLQSSVQFWNMFTDLAETMRRVSDRERLFAWLGVVPSMVESHKGRVQEMLKWIRMFYGEYVMSSELPLTEAIKTSGTELATVFDVEKYVGSAKTYERARVAFDKFVDEVDLMTRRHVWNEPESEE